MPAAVLEGTEALQKQEEMVMLGHELNPMALTWFKSEFAAANAIIDSLCAHIVQISEIQQPCNHCQYNHEDYKEVFSLIHRRRANWIPILNNQKYVSIADISFQLQNVLKKQQKMKEAMSKGHQPNGLQQQAMSTYTYDCSFHKADQVEDEQGKLIQEDGDAKKDHQSTEEACSADYTTSKLASNAEPPEEFKNEPPANGIIGSGLSQEDDHSCMLSLTLCSDHEECMTRRERINIVKGFAARESIKGHMVNVVKGMKIYESVFTDLELLKVGDKIRELRTAGQSGELPGESYILFNKELRGNKREVIQLGVPLYQPSNSEETSHIEPIPAILQEVISHLLKWRLLPQSKRPNSCIINFYDEGEHSQPYFKPPHLENPISTLFLQETTMAFGRALMSDNSGNYTGTLALSLKQGSFLVLRGNSADKARHVVCPSTNARVSITFARVRTPINHQGDSASPTKASTTLWMPKDNCGAYGCPGLIPTTWGVAMPATPILMLAPPMEPIVPMPLVETSPITAINNQTCHESYDIRNVVCVGGIGTGVYLPWMVGGSKKFSKQTPRFKNRTPLLPPSSMSPSPGKQVHVGNVSCPIPCPSS